MPEEHRKVRRGEKGRAETKEKNSERAGKQEDRGRPRAREGGSSSSVCMRKHTKHGAGRGIGVDGVRERRRQPGSKRCSEPV